MLDARRREYLRLKARMDIINHRGYRLPHSDLAKLLDRTTGCYEENKIYDDEYRHFLEERASQPPLKDAAE